MEKKYVILTLIFGLALVGAVSFLYQDSLTKQACIQVITRAENPVTGEVRDFGTPCDVSSGWQVVSPTETEEETSSPSELSLRLEENKKVDNLSIQLTDITDSRCPVDVQCIWAGEVKATVTFSLNGKSQIKTLTFSGPEESIFGYSVKFVRVTPGPRSSSTPVDKKEYVATFSIIKEALPVLQGEGAIRGTVTIGPMCPVVRVGEECPDKPYATTLLLQDQKGKTIKTIIVPENGQFELSVPVGSYIILPKVNSIMPRAEAVSVSVFPGQVSSVTISFDSGIR
jgi:hypothetical protein